MSESINRAFMYGESVFTTMRMINDRLCDWEYHFDRLKKGVEFVFGPFIDDSWTAHFKNRVETRLFAEAGDKVIRVTVYKDQTARGLVKKSLLSVNDLKVMVTTVPYDPLRSEGKKLRLRTCAAPQRPHWWPSYLKSGDYLETILSQKIFMKPGDDDVLFLSSDDTITESSVANIFVVRHNKLYTPSPGPNVLEGVMRRKVIEASSYFFEGFEESATSMAQLYRADAVFGTNSVRGPFLIERIDDHELIYEQEFLSKFEILRKRVFG